MADWAAVAKAVDERVRELGWSQGELPARSKVSRATVREIQHHKVERPRDARTLEALSVALQWPPNHLEAVAHGRPLPSDDGVSADEREELHSRIDSLERDLADIREVLGALRGDVRTVIEHVRGSR